MRDNGIYNVPLSPDLKFKECVCEMGVSIVEMYSGVISLRALYVSIALLYLILLATGIQPSSWNIRVDGVSKSAFRIIRAARFCNFDSLSIFAADVDPQITEP